MKFDRLATMVEWQIELMKLLGVRNGAQHSSNFSMAQFEAAVGMITEAAEVVDVINTNTKPWKAMTKEVAMERVLDETVDVLFFVLELFYLLFGDNIDILVEAFHKKNLIVKARWLSTRLSSQNVSDALARVRAGVTLRHPTHKDEEAFIVLQSLLDRFPQIQCPEHQASFVSNMPLFIKEHYYGNSSSTPPFK